MIKRLLQIKLNKGLFILLFVHTGFLSIAQSVQDSTALSHEQHADDPASFITRVELYNEFQFYGEDVSLNQTILRTIVKLGRRFTTRLDIPYVSNTVQTQNAFDPAGLGDISFRLLGYKIAEARKTAITASIEISLNTAASPILGTGKNLIVPVVSFTRLIPRGRMIFAAVVQQTNSFSGDKERATINFTKVQLILIKIGSGKFWSVVAPSTYFDYINGGVSMNLEARIMYAPKARINFWGQAGVGLFGDFVGRYDWAAQAGCRYFLLRESKAKRI